MDKFTETSSQSGLIAMVGKSEAAKKPSSHKVQGR